MLFGKLRIHHTKVVSKSGFVLGTTSFVPKLAPGGSKEVSPGWSPPRRTEPWESVPF
ncbi:hypothetical protein SBA5_160028 [Candidatus Sulfotelmatomonas gaucii]|uniref:Uncharacterized protein n=1 Tax=Candidatus Sulfuritelmatomonas gaucii TaxID=2043161 RepID=A0A2N9L680_9BACT|nr:hypothetical protein SBA5_160028 [Candidatus Sulfotelmatomonas gaucii]